MLILEQLEDRLCPAPLPAGTAITYSGGRELTSPQVVMIHADPSLTTFMDQAETVVLQQVIPTTVTSTYGIQAGALVFSVNVAPLAGTNLTTTVINNEIASLIAAGKVPPPGSNTLYIYCLAPNQIVTDEGGLASGGYHSNFPLGGQTVVMAGIYNQTANIPSNQLGLLLPQYLEHETIEAATDAIYPTGWVDAALQGNGEVMDLYAGQAQYFFQMGSFTFQAIAAPDGSPIPSPALPAAPPSTVPSIESEQQAAFMELANLVAVAAEQFSALEYRLLALIDPRDFAVQAQTAQQELASNPLLHTPPGQYAADLGWLAFVQANGTHS